MRRKKKIYRVQLLRFVKSFFFLLKDSSIIFVPCEPFLRFRTRRKKKEGRKKKEENYHRDVPTEGKKKRSLPSIRGTLKKTK